MCRRRKLEAGKGRGSQRGAARGEGSELARLLRRFSEQ